MDLCNRGGCNRGLVNLTEQVVRMRAALFDHGADLQKWHGLHAVLQFFELPDHLRGQEVCPGAQYLAEFHKGRAEFFNGKPHPFVHGGRFRRTAVDRIPSAGMIREHLFQYYAKTVFSQDFNDLGEPLDLRDHVNLYAFVILKVFFHPSDCTDNYGKTREKS